MIPKWDISKTDHWKNVSYIIGSLISSFFILNREILTELIWDFSIHYFSNDFWYRDFKIHDDLLFQSPPMPAVSCFTAPFSCYADKYCCIAKFTSVKSFTAPGSGKDFRLPLLVMTLDWWMIIKGSSFLNFFLSILNVGASFIFLLSPVATADLGSSATQDQGWYHKKYGRDWQTKTIKWEETVQRSMRSWLLWDEMNFEIFI